MTKCNSSWMMTNTVILNLKFNLSHKFGNFCNYFKVTLHSIQCLLNEYSNSTSLSHRSILTKLMLIWKNKRFDIDVYYFVH